VYRSIVAHHCHNAPRHGPKTFPESDAGYTCYQAPSTSPGAYQRGGPRRCDPLASVAQTPKRLPKCKIPSPSCSQSQRSCRIGVAPKTDNIPYFAAVLFVCYKPPFVIWAAEMLTSSSTLVGYSRLLVRGLRSNNSVQPLYRGRRRSWSLS
jgi:hypothetical protein